MLVHVIHQEDCNYFGTLLKIVNFAIKRWNAHHTSYVSLYQRVNSQGKKTKSCQVQYNAIVYRSVYCIFVGRDVFKES